MTKNQNVVYGLHALEHALKAYPQAIERVYLAEHLQAKQQDKKHQRLIQALSRHGIQLVTVNVRVLDDMMQGAVHQGMVALLKPRSAKTVHLEEVLDADKKQLFLVLDGVQDPHNLGACLRTAYAAGATAVIIPKDRSVGLNATVRKVACGAAEHVPLITVTNLARALKTLQEQGVWVYGMAEGGQQDLYGTAFTTSTAFVLGSEGQGLRENTKRHCDELVHIPCSQEFSTLNVSVATGVCLFEYVRQQLLA